MADEIFVDMVGNVTITGSVVRVDLMTLDPAKPDAKGRPSRTLRQRLVMPADGFVGLANAAMLAMARLEKAGVVKRQPTKRAKSEGREAEADAKTDAPTSNGR